MKINSFILICFLSITTMAQLKNIKNGVYKWEDHPVKFGELRESRKILEGVTPHLDYLEIHSTTQYPGAKPGKAHATADREECIIVTEGQMKVTIEGKSQILGPGGVFLLMPGHMHSIENMGETNLVYFVMMYRSKKEMDIKRGMASGGSIMLHSDSLDFKQTEHRDTRSYFDRSTAMCERFEMHVTTLKNKGPSHKPHKHIESEIILVLSGETEMTIDGKEYKGGKGDLYFMDSQLEHGIRNSTDKECSYFAFKWN